MIDNKNYMYFSATTNSFYDLRLNYKELPEDIVNVSENLYLNCINPSKYEILVSDDDGNPKLESLSEEEIGRREALENECKYKCKQYEIDISSIIFIRNIILENKDIFQETESLSQLIKLQDDCNQL